MPTYLVVNKDLATVNGATVAIPSLPNVSGILAGLSPSSIAVDVDEPVDQDALTSWANTQGASVSTDNSFLAGPGWKLLPIMRPRSVVPPTPQVRPPRASASLEVLKANRAVAVDKKTDRLIANGFTVDGKVFSASDAAQLKWLGMYTSRADLSYPVTVPTKDDTQFASLIEAADVVTYYTALLARIQTVLAGGVTLKAQIAAATNQGDLDAVVDNRT